MTQMVRSLLSVPSTQAEKRAAINRQNYERNKDRILLRYRIQRLTGLAGQILEGMRYANS
jgi:hypothetical protein